MTSGNKRDVHWRQKMILKSGIWMHFAYKEDTYLANIILRDFVKIRLYISKVDFLRILSKVRCYEPLLSDDFWNPK